MTAAAIILAALLAVGAVLLVARPFLRDPEARREGDASRDEAALERARLLDERDRALAALKELEFDHRTGKISDADYRELVGPLRQEAAAAIRALEPASGSPRPARSDPPDLPVR